MLDLNPEVVCFIIAKTRQFHAKEEVVIPEEPLSPSDDWALQVLADHEDDFTYLELKSAIDDLEPDQQASLVALLWLGRGEYEADDFESALEDAQRAWNKRTAEYVIATPLVADYLQEGLSALGYSCDE